MFNGLRVKKDSEMCSGCGVANMISVVIVALESCMICEQLVTVIRKASHPCCRPAAQPVLRQFREESGKRWDKTRSDTAGRTVDTRLRCCEPSQSVKNQRQRVQCVPTCFRQESCSDGRYRFGVWRGRPRRSEPPADRRIGTGTIDDYETHSETLQGRTARCTTPLFLETWSERSKKTNQCFLAPGRSNQQHVGHGLDCIPWFRSQVCTIPGTTVY